MNAKRILWRGSAEIEYSATRAITDETLALVNRYAGGTATADNVYVARMVVCNDQVDHYSTKFTKRALDQIVPLMLGANVMRNHNEYGSEDLPIGRIFNAGQEAVGGIIQDWAEFYWERGTEDGDAMARKIGLRLWRECSLSWWMTSFTASVTGKPFDESPGMYPGLQMPDGTTVIGMMDDVTEVNEVSVVARGGQKGTSIAIARGADDPSVGAAVVAMRARASGPDREAGGALSRYLAKNKPTPMAWYYERLGIGKK